MWMAYAGGYGGGYGYAPSPGDYTNAMMQYAGSDSTYSRERRTSYSSPGIYSQVPTAAERQQRAAQEQLKHSLNASPDEITSGTALNVLLADIKKMAEKAGWSDLPRTNLELDGEQWAHINITRGSGSIAILKNGVQLSWPAALSGAELQEQRKQVEALGAQALSQARSQGTVDMPVTSTMADVVSNLQRDLRRRTPGLTFDLHVEAKSFLNNLDDAIVTLQRPDAGTYLSDNFRPKAESVLDLVRWLNNRGLRVARAMPGDESAYLALHQQLAAYARLLHQDENGAP
jgi:hypothetical protein